MLPAREPSTSLFDGFVENYDDACGRGLALSGESRDYFAEQRIAHTKRLCSKAPIRRVVDFGCGLGHSTPYFVEAFPAATIVGVDTSAGAIRRAQQRYGSDRVEFATTTPSGPAGQFDLAYSNGTFHHIVPSNRSPVMREIFDWLAPGGVFALWENNPWNPGTRLVMRRIPFDRDAQTLSYLTAEKLVSDAGFRVLAVSFHFYFPSWLRGLRRFEDRLRRCPLGAQYCVLGQKPVTSRLGTAYR